MVPWKWNRKLAVGLGLHNTDNQALLNVFHWIVILVVFGSLFALSMFAYATLPEPKPPSDNLFSETRARSFLKRMELLGARPTGSDAEIKARGVLVEELESIKATANPLHEINIETQTVTGCFDSTQCYVGIVNVMARIGSKGGSRSSNALLVNCHYDSVPAGPGASDDLVSCAVTMEILRLLSAQNQLLEHDVIFLFNGAEETGLRAAHGFITQHPWRHDCRAVINLESNGAGGKEMLFQAGPRNWILKSYLEAAPRPSATVMGQELFQHNIVPGGTDFVVFVEYGNLTGLDFAFIRNDYLYHTEFDQERYVDSGSMQHEGENILNVIRIVLKAPQMLDANEVSKREINDIYFDVLGLFLIVYSTTVAAIIQGTVVLIVIVKIFWTLFDKNSYSTITLGLSFASHVISIIIMLLTGYVLAQIVLKIDLTLTWYSKPWKLAILYGIPSLATGLCSYFLSNFVVRRIKSNEHIYIQEKAQLDSFLLICALIITLGTIFTIASTYLIFLLLMFLLLRDVLMFVIDVLFRAVTGSLDCGPTGAIYNRGCCSEGDMETENAAAIQSDDGRAHSTPLCVMYLVHILCSVPGLLMIVYSSVIFLDLFVPVMGRTGGRLNPEVFMAMFCTFIAITCACTFSSLVRISKVQLGLCVFLLVGTLVFYIVLLTTSLKNPFVYDINQPRLRRLVMRHTVNHQNSNDTESTFNNMVFLRPTDYRPASDLPSELTVNSTCLPSVCLRSNETIYFPHPARITLLRKASSINASSNISTVEMDIEIQGSDHMGSYFEAQQGYTIQKWNNDVKNTSAVSMSVICGFANCTFTFSLTMTKPSAGPSNADDDIVWVSLDSHHVHGAAKRSQSLSKLVDMITKKRDETTDWKWAITPDYWTTSSLTKYI